MHARTNVWKYTFWEHSHEICNLTLSALCPSSLKYCKLPSSLPYCSLYFVTHWICPFLPCVPTRVTLVCWSLRSICSHCSSLFFLVDQAPPFSGHSSWFSLPFLVLRLLSHWEEALIWLSDIAPFSMPRGYVYSHSKSLSSSKKISTNTSSNDKINILRSEKSSPWKNRCLINIFRYKYLRYWRERLSILSKPREFIEWPRLIIKANLARKLRRHLH